MQTRTICCKLMTTETMGNALLETSQCFADACNQILKIATQEKTHNAIKLHKLCYMIIREQINPAYTSQTCHHCLKLGSRIGERFSCLTCGEQHVDVNASHVIALGGAVCKPARISDES